MVPVRCAVYVAAFLLVVTLQECEGAKILAIFPIPARSHATVDFALVKELAHRGHHVSVLSPFPQETSIPNYTDITIEKLSLNISVSDAPNSFDIQRFNYVRGITKLWELGAILCERLLETPPVQKLMHSVDQHFDLLILEAFCIDCFLGFSHKFKVPVIQISTFGGTEYMGDLVGNPNPYAYVPDPFQEFSDRMNFKERILNTLGGLFQQIGRRYYSVPRHDAIMRKHFNYTRNMPSISELEKSTALVLVNHHFSISYPKPLVPNLVQVGGMHLKPPTELPADVKIFIDEAAEGVIYFSMGSNLNSSQMFHNKLRAILESFSKLNQRVLWKWEGDTLPGKPSNVKVAKWLPQSDILAHPNVRLFITHGGLLSTQETIYHGVPVIGIPIFGDQKLNMARAVSAGFGIQLEYANITAQSLSWAMSEVLDIPRYSENAQRLSRIYRDQPLTPLQQAVFWTEYVIRHKGAPHMRSAVLDLNWYQYFLLDVIAVLALVVGSVLLLVFLTLKVVLRKFCGGTRHNTNTSVERKQK